MELSQNDKGHLWKTIVNIILKGKKQNASPKDQGQDENVSLTTSIHLYPGDSSASRQGKKRSFTNDLMIYVENVKESTLYPQKEKPVRTNKWLNKTAVYKSTY